MSFYNDQFPDLPEKLSYDIIRDSVVTKRFTKEELKKLKDEGLEIDMEDKDEDEEIRLSPEEEEREKKEYNANLLHSPFPQTKGKFGDCIAFSDRIRLMEQVPGSEGRVFKSVIRKAGKNAREVTKEDAVLFHLNAFVAEVYDQPFDSTFARKKPVLSKLNQVLKGYALSMLTMKVGELSEFAIHRTLAYGELGCPPRIPPAADIIVVIELLDVYSKGTVEYYHAMSHRNDAEEDETVNPEKLLEFAHEDRTKGSDLYRAGDFHRALYYYRRAIDLLERTAVENNMEDECNGILLTLYHNTANCYIQLMKGPAIINYAKRALRIDPDSIKANYQLGKGYSKLGKLDKARFYLMKARKFRPNDPDINRELEDLDRKLVVECMDTKNLYKQMGKAFVAGTGQATAASTEAGGGAEAGPSFEIRPQAATSRGPVIQEVGASPSDPTGTKPSTSDSTSTSKTKTSSTDTSGSTNGSVISADAPSGLAGLVAALSKQN